MNEPTELATVTPVPTPEALAGLKSVTQAVVLVGFAVLFVAWLWMVYRVIKGWLMLTEGKPVYPDQHRRTLA